MLSGLLLTLVTLAGVQAQDPFAAANGGAAANGNIQPPADNGLPADVVVPGSDFQDIESVRLGEGWTQPAADPSWSPPSLGSTKCLVFFTRTASRRHFYFRRLCGFRPLQFGVWQTSCVSHLAAGCHVQFFDSPDAPADSRPFGTVDGESCAAAA